MPLQFNTIKLFSGNASQELAQCTDDIHTALNQVLSFFPSSAFLHTQRALLYYHSKDFEESESIFSNLMVSEPYRLDAMDNYSNVIYVLENRGDGHFDGSTITRMIEEI